MGEPYRQNPDGSWSPAVPMGWQGSDVDWEIYPRDADGRYRAEGFDEDLLVATVSARTKFGLYFKIRRATTMLRQTEDNLRRDDD
jgi:hypothetical protein